MDKLQAKKIPVYRTVQYMTIICTSDGKNIIFSTKPGDYKYGSSALTTPSKSSTTTQTKSSATNSRIVYWTPNGESYHYDRNCKALKKSKTILSRALGKCSKKDTCNFCVH